MGELTFIIWIAMMAGGIVYLWHSDPRRYRPVRSRTHRQPQAVATYRHRCRNHH